MPGDNSKKIEAERDRYRRALERICENGRNPIAEEALGLHRKPTDSPYDLSVGRKGAKGLKL